jgi:hypothetical protein
MMSSLQSGEGRGVAALLNEARDQAGQIASELDQLGIASDGVTRVQRLVGRLRDMAVVGLDLNLQPPQRATIQRQVDALLDEIDLAANDIQVDDGLVHGGASSASSTGGVATDGPRLVPFRAISTAMLGLAGLAVRSADQALAATGALDRATARLQRTGKSLSTTTARLERDLQGLTNPSTTATGEPALEGETAALGSTLLLRRHLLTSSDQAVQVQAELDIPRARWLLDWDGR